MARFVTSSQRTVVEGMRGSKLQCKEIGQCACGMMPATRFLQGGGLAFWNNVFRSSQCLPWRSECHLLVCQQSGWKYPLPLCFLEAGTREAGSFSVVQSGGGRRYRTALGSENGWTMSRPWRKKTAFMARNASVCSGSVVGGDKQALIFPDSADAAMPIRDPDDLDVECQKENSEPDLKEVEAFLNNMDLEPFEMLGINRRAFERIIAKDKQLLSYTGAQLLTGLKALLALEIQKENVADLVQECPSVLILDLEELLMPMFRELDIDRQAVSRLLRYNPKRVLRVRNTNFRKNIDFLASMGLSKQQVAAAVRASPQLLILDLDTEIVPKLAFLQSYGVTEAGVRTIVSHFPSILNHNIQNNLLPKINFLQSIGVKNIGLVLSRSPGYLGLSIEKNVIPKIKQLESIGFSPDVIGSVIERSPTILSLRFDNMKQKLGVFERLGFTADEAAQIACRAPILLGLKIEGNLLPKLEFLQELIVDKSKISKILMNCPTFFQYNLDKHLRPLIAFLERVGLKGERLRTLIVAKPVVLTLSMEGSLVQTMQFLEGIGLELGTPAMARAFSSCLSNRVASMQSRLNWLVEYGFTHEEALTMARKQPSILTIGQENITAKMEFLTNQAGLKTGDIVKSVALLTYSLELRMKPRYRVICWLKDTERLKKLSVSSAMVLSDDRFFERFIKSDPEAAAMYSRPVQQL